MGDEPFSQIKAALCKSDDALLRDFSLEIINWLVKVANENKQLRKDLDESRRENSIRAQERKIEILRLMKEA